MVYMGSKSKYASYIVPVLQKIIDATGATEYIEYFCGGCNIIDKIKCENKYAYDRSDTLIALLRQAAEDFSQLPEDGSREMWDKGKGYVKDGVMPEDMSLADIGAIEFFASFSNGGFPRGYAKNSTTRNYYKEAWRNLREQAPNLKGITFGVKDYTTVDPLSEAGAVIYLDPPYQGTKFYGYANQPKMDYTFFWNWVRELSKQNFVIVSEQSAPEDFIPIWTQKVTRTTNKENNFKAVENLWVYDNPTDNLLFKGKYDII